MSLNEKNELSVRAIQKMLSKVSDILILECDRPSPANGKAAVFVLFVSVYPFRHIIDLYLPYID